jgi:hypothetical protein
VKNLRVGQINPPSSFFPPFRAIRSFISYEGAGISGFFVPSFFPPFPAPTRNPSLSPIYKSSLKNHPLPCHAESLKGQLAALLSIRHRERLNT